jgi:hypothetical protein
MSFLKRHHDDRDHETDDDHDETIDSELRLRTVRTAASAIAESIRSEQRAQRRKMRKGSRFFRSLSERRKPNTPPDTSNDRRHTIVSGVRRNIYVNHPLPILEVDGDGEPLVRYVRNKVRTSSMLCIVCLCLQALRFLQSIQCSHSFRRICTSNFDGVLPCLRRNGLLFYTPLLSVANVYFLLLVILQGNYSDNGRCLRPCSSHR